MPCPIASITRRIDALALTSRTRASHDERGSSHPAPCRRVQAPPGPSGLRSDVTQRDAHVGGRRHARPLATALPKAATTIAAPQIAISYQSLCSNTVALGVVAVAMALKLKPTHSPEPPPFSWDNLPATPSTSSDVDPPSSPPIPWLSAPDMKVFGVEPLKPEIGLVKCKDCGKPVLRSAVEEHLGEARQTSRQWPANCVAAQPTVPAFVPRGRRTPSEKRQTHQRARNAKPKMTFLLPTTLPHPRRRSRQPR